ncbi:hypothetical protein F7Q91_03160 [Vibrio chagasii]|uniref:Uncharacterized protein n=1 Tax=Vibrio chagasii TaxID=170679 RepID=A0A7V7NX86_9VIBR|nr:hypothetical protein [Vibrio chagasii]KAB0482421.1 hypothetical protein F7Q91_03160 [Vibrio chagasii]
MNNKVTSKSVAAQAARTLSTSSSSKIAKQLAASALSQRDSSKQTGSKLEAKASHVLTSSKYSKQTKTYAASVLSQSNKGR